MMMQHLSLWLEELTKTVLTGKEPIQGTPVGEKAAEAELGMNRDRIGVKRWCQRL